MLIKFGTFGALGIAILTCYLSSGVQAQSVAELTAGAAPFSQLDEVRLGMRVSELVKVRPSIVRLEDYLHGEDIDEYHVHYASSAPFAIYNEDPELNEVTVSRDFSDDSGATNSWEARIADLRDGLGQPTECFRVVTGSRRSDHALWVKGGIEVMVSVGRDRSGQSEQRSAAVILRVLRARKPSEWAGTEGYQALPCPI